MSQSRVSNWLYCDHRSLRPDHVLLSNDCVECVSIPFFFIIIICMHSLVIAQCLLPRRNHRNNIITKNTFCMFRIFTWNQWCVCCMQCMYATCRAWCGHLYHLTMISTIKFIQPAQWVRCKQNWNYKSKWKLMWKDMERKENMQQNTKK